MTTAFMNQYKRGINIQSAISIGLAGTLVAMAWAGASLLGDIRSDINVQRQRIDGNCNDIQKIEKTLEKIDGKLDILLMGKK